MAEPRIHRHIPMVKIYKDAWATVWQHRGVLFKRLMIYVLMLSLMEFSLTLLPEDDYNLTEFNIADLIGCMVFMVFVGISYLPILTVLSIRGYRIFLLGPEFVPPGLPTWSTRERWYWAWMFKALLLMSMLYFELALLFPQLIESDVYNFLYLLPTAYLACRINLAFTAIAIDQNPTLKWSWTLTLGQGWKLVFMLIIPVELLYQVSHYLIGYSHYTDLLVILIINIWVIMNIAISSHTFKFLTEEPISN